jgi:hypothetical protein
LNENRTLARAQAVLAKLAKQTKRLKVVESYDSSIWSTDYLIEVVHANGAYWLPVTIRNDINDPQYHDILQDFATYTYRKQFTLENGTIQQISKPHTIVLVFDKNGAYIIKRNKNTDGTMQSCTFISGCGYTNPLFDWQQFDSSHHDFIDELRYNLITEISSCLVETHNIEVRRNRTLNQSVQAKPHDTVNQNQQRTSSNIPSTPIPTRATPPTQQPASSRSVMQSTSNNTSNRSQPVPEQSRTLNTISDNQTKKSAWWKWPIIISLVVMLFSYLLFTQGVGELIIIGALSFITVLMLRFWKLSLLLLGLALLFVWFFGQS